MTYPTHATVPTSSRPIVKLDAQHREINKYNTPIDDLAYQGDNTSGTTIIYKGWARPGTATSVEEWKISKYAYDVSGNVTSITWPEISSGIASSDFVFEWDNRASYTYI